MTARTREDWTRLLEHEPSYSLRNMVKALNMLPFLNTEDDEARLAAARDVLKARGGR